MRFSLVFSLSALTLLLASLSASHAQQPPATTQNPYAPQQNTSMSQQPTVMPFQQPNPGLVAQQVAPAPMLQPVPQQNTNAPAQPQTAAPAEQPVQPNPVGDMLATQNTPPPSGVVPVTSTDQMMIAAPPQEQLRPVDEKPDALNEAADQPPREQVRGAPQGTPINGDTTPVATLDAAEAAQAQVALDIPIETESAAESNNQGINMDLDPSLVNDDGGSDELDFSVAQEELPYEEQLRIRLKELEQRAREQAFEQSKRSVLPLETYQIRDLLRRLKDTQEAIQKPVRKAPTPQNVIKTVSMDPAAKSETINLAVGNVTALNVVDMTGAPWPIVDIAFGGNFDIKAPEPGGNIIRVTPLRDFAQGNLVLRLLNLTTPITFTMEAGGDTVNYRFDARVPQYGPNARMPIIEEGVKIVAGDSVVNSVLEGIAPNGADKLKVEGVDARTSAYRVGGALYVRTPLTLLSPAWRSNATSADGMNVYVLAEAPVLLLSDQGNLVRARLSTAPKGLGEQ